MDEDTFVDDKLGEGEMDVTQYRMQGMDQDGKSFLI